MEIVAAVGEPILSAALSTIFGKLASSDLLEFADGEKVLVEIKMWETKLLDINAVLKDAEEQQMERDPVKNWLRDLRCLAYDVEDILDEFSTEALRRKLIVEAQASKSKVWTFFLSCFTSLCRGDVKFNVRMGSELKKITRRLEEIEKNKNGLHLKENVGGMSNRPTDQRTATTSVVDRHVRGREGDKNAVVELLLGGEATNNDFSVISIVGMGGLGKTTLAQLVYNDKRVTDHFELRAWVCVSEDFDILKITKTLLQSIPPKETCDLTDLNSLQVELKKKLNGKKFLIVLDDVWNQNYARWEELCKPFTAGVPGCKLLVTTRNDGVASTMGTNSAHRVQLQVLSNEVCLSLLEKYALGTRNFGEFPNLKEIGVEIVKKCKGLPLAVKTLGGLLRTTKEDRDEWEAVLKSKIWELPGDKNDILPALKLSYHNLPSCLKRCFAYCSLFPKDYEFDKNELVLLWMAEGFLHQSEGNKQMEDLGRQYFDDLLSRSFFQQSSADESRYVMHDLINDLAQFVADDVCFRLDDKEENDKQYEISEKVRHLSLLPRSYEISKRFEVFSNGKCLRTFLTLPTDDWPANYLSDKVVHDLLPKFKRLRALSLSGYLISELSNSVGDLKQLRYLNLSFTDITQLPDSVGALYNLQTLILCRCPELVELPADMKNLIDLQHLDITGTISLRKMPAQIGNLKKLRILPKFIVGKGDELRIRELKELSHLQGRLTICGLDNVRDVQDAGIANLKLKQGLDELAMQWSDEFHDMRNEQDEKRVLGLLQPHPNLKKLKITSYGGVDFPYWVGDPFFINIVDITLEHCANIKSLPSLGRLPSLKSLRIQGMQGVKRVGSEFYGASSPFPCLETLQFVAMLGWEEWSCCSSVEDEAEEKFPHLRELTILNCPKLKGDLPSHLPSLVKLNISKCPLLADSLKRLPSLRELELEDCNEVVLGRVVDLTSLSTIKMRRISALACLCVRLVQKLVALKDLEIGDCSELICLWQSGAELGNLACLRRLVIKNCPQLVSLAGEEEGLLLYNLEELELVGCSNLEKLPNGLHSLTCLKSLKIVECPKLVSLAGEEEGLLPCNLEKLKLEGCDNLEKLPNGLHSLTCLKSLKIVECPKLVSLQKTSWPYTLRYLEIYDCEALGSLPDGMMMHNISSSNQSLLEELEISNCPCLKSFPKGKLPTTLKKLKIEDCENLESLPEGMMHNDNNGNSHLEELFIEGCSSLASFPTGEFPATLKRLEINNCKQLESFSERMLQNHKSLEVIEIKNCENIRSLQFEFLYNLRDLVISNCPALESFPERGFSIPNLKSFEIIMCENLKSLPRQMDNLTSLQRLRILECPGLVSIPEGGLPPNLTSILIENCENLKQPMTEWGLNTLASLTVFNIWGPCPAVDMASFPDDDCRILPTTLTTLHIGNLENLESLSRGLQNLTSLRFLDIQGCPKIQSLPKDGLPASLESLSICSCPLLEQWCLKEKRDYWPSIAHIPSISIGNL